MVQPSAEQASSFGRRGLEVLPLDHDDPWNQTPVDLSERSEILVEASVPAPSVRTAVRLRSRSLLHSARDRLLTVAAVATILAATFGLGPFEARNANGPGTIERVAAIR